MQTKIVVTLLLAVTLAACGGGEAPPQQAEPAETVDAPPLFKQGKYATVRLSADLSELTAGEREVLPLLVDACRAIDLAFWLQAFGPKVPFLSSIPDPDARRFAEINYGPWDRLAADRAFLPVGPKPATARFYPVDLQPNELEQAAAASADGGAMLRGPYTIVRRDEKGALTAVAYHELFASHLEAAAGKLREAASATDSASLRRFLELRAEALTTDSFGSSDEAWMEHREGALNLIIGPIDPGEDFIARTKRAYVGAVLLNRPSWSARLDRYRSMLPELAGEMLLEPPAGGSPRLEFEVADLLYSAGSWNAGPKRIALEMPPEGALRKRAGARRLQLRNVGRAKFDHTLVPLANQLVANDQRGNATFEAFFTNDLLLEMVRSSGSSDRSNSLAKLYGETAWIVDVARAGMVGLHLAGLLGERGETGAEPLDHYVSFVASAFRSLRFGSASAQGPASLIWLNHFRRSGSIARDPETGTYRIDLEVMRRSVQELAETLASAHVEENAAAVGRLLGGLSTADAELVADLTRLAEARVPIDVVFEF